MTNTETEPATTPRRVQRTRPRIKGTKGMPPGAVYVGRPGRWGNPFPAYDSGIKERALAALLFANLLAQRDSHPFPEHLMPYPTDADIRAELAGRDLACWCPLPASGEIDHCHAAVLLRIANSPAGAGL
jgi:hypothetical protein